MRKATLIVMWIIFAGTFIFIFCAFAAILNWFDDREIVGMVTRYSGYSLLGLGVLMMFFMLLDKKNFSQD